MNGINQPTVISNTNPVESNDGVSDFEDEPSAVSASTSSGNFNFYIFLN